LPLLGRLAARATRSDRALGLVGLELAIHQRGNFLCHVLLLSLFDRRSSGAFFCGVAAPEFVVTSVCLLWCRAAGEASPPPPRAPGKSATGRCRSGNSW